MHTSRPTRADSVRFGAGLKAGASIAAIAAVMAVTPAMAQDAPPDDDAVEVVEVVITGIRASLASSQDI